MLNKIIFLSLLIPGTLFAADKASDKAAEKAPVKLNGDVAKSIYFSMWADYVSGGKIQKIDNTIKTAVTTTLIVIDKEKGSASCSRAIVSSVTPPQEAYLCDMK